MNERSRKNYELFRKLKRGAKTMKFKCNRCRKIFATRQSIGCDTCRPSRNESRSSDGTMLTEVNHLPNWVPATEYTVINDSWSGGGGSYGGGGSGGSWSDGGSSDSGSSGGGGGGD